MRLSTKSRFAVNLMIEVAVREPQGPVTLQTVGERLGISRTYLEQLTSRLRTQRLLLSSRGRAGGYVLARAAADISVADIVAAVEMPAEDEAQEGEVSHEPRQAQALWSRLHEKMAEFLQSVSLESLVADHQADKTPAPAARERGVYARPQTKPVQPGGANSVFNLARALAR